MTGVLMVTTPRDISLADAPQKIVMFTKVGVPVVGIVENMIMHICGNYGHLEAIFGAFGAKKLAKQYQGALLGQLPLRISLREELDCGEPPVVSRPENKFTEHIASWWSR